MCELCSLDTANFCCSVKLLQGKNAGEVVRGVAYEDVCKMSK